MNLKRKSFTSVLVKYGLNVPAQIFPYQNPELASAARAKDFNIAVAIVTEMQNCEAILHTRYGGQAGGQAVADGPFGEYNLAGHLHVTFQQGIQQLSGFREYSMKACTYHYMTWNSLCPVKMLRTCKRTLLSSGAKQLLKIDLLGKIFDFFDPIDTVENVIPGEYELRYGRGQIIKT